MCVCVCVCVCVCAGGVHTHVCLCTYANPLFIVMHIFQNEEVLQHVTIPNAHLNKQGECVLCCVEFWSWMVSVVLGFNVSVVRCKLCFLCEKNHPVVCYTVCGHVLHVLLNIKKCVKQVLGTVGVLFKSRRTSRQQQQQKERTR